MNKKRKNDVLSTEAVISKTTEEDRFLNKLQAGHQYPEEVALDVL